MNTVHISVKKYAVLLVFTAACIFLALFFIPRFAISSLPQVNVITVRPDSAKSIVSCTGTVDPEKQQNIYYSVPLKADKVYVHIGDSVRAGQKLVDVDTAETLETFQATQGTMASVNPAQSSSVFSASSLPPGMTAEQYKSLMSSYSAANTVPSAGGSSAKQESTSAAQRSGAVPEIPSFIKSPIAGVVTGLNASRGSFTSPSVPVAVITNINDLQIKAQVDEILISSIKTGQPATIKGSGFKSVYNGTVKKIYPAARQIITDSGTRTVVDVLIRIDKPGADLKPGLSTNIDIITAENSKSLIIPYESICEDGSDREYVYLCRNNHIFKTYIQTGREYTNRIEVTSGLKKGDDILLNPPENLKNRQTVRIKKVTEGETDD